MLVMHLMGHVHVSQDGQAVHVSSKAAALLTYLALEGRPHAREHLAELLWDTPDSLRNLRVELTRLRQQGLQPFPARQPTLALTCETDLDMWLARTDQLTERQLPDWLSALRGPPLSGLEDLGSAAFRRWLDAQRRVITGRIEAALRRAHTHFSRAGRPEAAGLIRARADVLGVALGQPAPPPPTELTLEWPEPLSALRGVMGQAQDTPQLVLLHGPFGSRRALLRALLNSSSWKGVQLQASPHRRLVQAALARHLGRGQPTPDAVTAPPAAGQDDDQDLVRIADLLARQGAPVLLALHDAPVARAWLPESMRFLLNLPLPLLLVLSSTNRSALRHLREALGPMDGARVHHLHLAPLSAGTVTRALHAQDPHVPLDVQRARATRLAQQAEGWPVYVQALLRRPWGPPGALPDVVRELLVAELTGLPDDLRRGLSRLAQLHDHFTPEFAQLLLGRSGQAVLDGAQQAGVLVTVGAHEGLRFPELRFRSSDAETHLAFSNEPIRVALAGLLPPAERHAVRCQLAELLLPVQPALSVLYAEKAQLADVAEQARAALPHLPRVPARRAALALRSEPPGQPGVPGWMCVTPNGYRVALDQGFLEVLRRGRMGPPPLLSVTFEEVPAGPWQITLRLDVMTLSMPTCMTPPAYALGVRAGETARRTFSSEPLPDYAEGGVPHEFGGVLPLGSWVTLSGEGPGGRLELSVRAMDVALTVGAFAWGGRKLLPFLGQP